VYYEVEEALYKQLASAAKGMPNSAPLVISAARGIVRQIDVMLSLFNIEVLDLTAQIVRSHLNVSELYKQGIRAADALHVATAIAFEAEILVSADDSILGLDKVLKNSQGVTIRCLDTDAALSLLI
jgi:predicted nucleic acid-binding protein